MSQFLPIYYNNYFSTIFLIKKTVLLQVKITGKTFCLSLRVHSHFVQLLHAVPKNDCPPSPVPQWPKLKLCRAQACLSTESSKCILVYTKQARLGVNKARIAVQAQWRLTHSQIYVCRTSLHGTFMLVQYTKFVAQTILGTIWMA